MSTVNQQRLRALIALLSVCERMDAERQGERPTEEEYQAAIECAGAAIAATDGADPADPLPVLLPVERELLARSADALRRARIDPRDVDLADEIEGVLIGGTDHAAPRDDAWRPIESAPKDDTLIVLGAKNGVWLGKYLPVYGSGYKPENPWSSMLLNHDHMAERYTRPTHWMPLPAAPGADPAAPLPGELPPLPDSYVGRGSANFYTSAEMREYARAAIDKATGAA